MDWIIKIFALYTAWSKQPAVTFHSPQIRPGPRLRTGDHFLFWIVGTLFTVLYAFASPTFNGNVNATFEKMVYGQAARPYTYRLVMPLLIRGAADLLPDRFEAALNQRLSRNILFASAIRSDRWESDLLTLHLVAAGLMALCFVAFLYTLRALLLTLFTASANFALGFPLITLLGIYPLVDVRYIYDPGTLFLFTLGLTLLARARWHVYLPVYLLGCLNKETTILLCLVFAIYYGLGRRMEFKRFVGLLLVQLFTLVVVRLILSLVYTHNAGGAIEFHLFDHNIPLLLNADEYSLATFWIALGMGLLFFYRWQDQPPFLKNATWMILPLVILMLFFGWMNEWRDLLEVTPVVSLIYAYNIGKLFGFSIQKQPIPPAPRPESISHV